MDKPQFILREAQLSDHGFIYDPWVKSVSRQRPYSRCESSWLSAAQGSLISRLLGRSTVLVAANPDDSAHLFGYIAFELEPARLLHWIYVKMDMRRFGVGTSLINAAFGFQGDPVGYTFDTPAIGYHTERWNLVYQPEQLRRCVAP